jgi:hypothetical protein
METHPVRYSECVAARRESACDGVNHHDAVIELEAVTVAKDNAYHERNMLVAALSRLFPASLERHPDDDTEWDDDWRWIVFIELPNGVDWDKEKGRFTGARYHVASWHIHDSELGLFDHLPRLSGRFKWDGHTTEEKYERLKLINDSHGCPVCGERR